MYGRDLGGKRKTKKFACGKRRGKKGTQDPKNRILDAVPLQWNYVELGQLLLEL
jgi:hypothetical protein